MSKLKYVGLFLVIIIFGIVFIPKILNRITDQTIVESNRSQSAVPLNYIVLNGEAKKVPEFTLFNQDSLLISNEDFSNKVYVAEFFFTSCPSISNLQIDRRIDHQLDLRIGPSRDFKSVPTGL